MINLYIKYRYIISKYITTIRFIKKTNYKILIKKEKNEF
jgi:hypothetical protein